MTYTDKTLERAYRRAQQTRIRLENAIKEGAPAKKIAHLQTAYQQQREAYVTIKMQKMKL